MADLENIGQYEVLERIGVDSFTVAYRGRDTSSQRQVAIKICIAQEEHLRTGFLRLAEIASTLRHPNIVSVLEFGSGEGKPYLVEDYVPGEHLGWKIEAGERIPWVKRLDYLTQIAQGLRYAHTKGVLHRHVSPRCIRILEGDLAKISDFGIRQLAAASARLSDPRGHVETEGYLAPEQALGLRADARTDIFYFGALSYELLTFESPFAGDNLTDFLRRVLDTTDDATVARLRRLPEGISRILRRCLQREPAERYGDFSAVLDDLRPVLEKERARQRPSAEPPSPDDTQEIPPPPGAADPEATHLELATEYMIRPPSRGEEEGVKFPPGGTGLPSLDETLPGVPAPPTGAPKEAAEPEREEDLESTVYARESPVAAAAAAEPATARPAAGAFAGRAAAARSWNRRWLLAAGLGGVALLAILVAATSLSGSRARPEPAEPMAVAAPEPAAAEASRDGSLFVDAVPWGKVVRVSAADGRTVPLPEPAFTPLHLALPPGDYEVQISHPQADDRWTCQVRVTAGGSELCRGEFELVDVLDYFKATGWWQ